MTTVNHVGLCVTDLDRSRRFYEHALGFEPVQEMRVPDDFTTDLLRVPRPVGLTACYLRRGAFVLELLHFGRPDNPSARDRPFTEPGLTHLSFTVDDLAEARATVVEHGGEVLDDTEVAGMAVMIRDPDGQLVELLAPGLAPVAPSP